MDCLISGAYVSAYVSCMCFTYIQIFQSICVCMCLYVNGIQDHMHLIQPLSERRYIQIHADIFLYVSNIASAYAIWIALYLVHMCVHMYAVCASNTNTYINPYVCCMCFRYMHICIGRITDVVCWIDSVAKKLSLAGKLHVLTH